VLKSNYYANLVHTPESRTHVKHLHTDINPRSSEFLGKGPHKVK